jgi:hypothetical protein
MVETILQLNVNWGRPAVAYAHTIFAFSWQSRVVSDSRV